MNSMRKLLHYLTPYALFAFLGPFLMCIEVSMDLLQPTIMQKIIDARIAKQDNAYIVKMGLYMLATAFIGLIGGVGSSITQRGQQSISQPIYAGMCSGRRSNFQV